MTQHLSTRPADQRIQMTVSGVLVADSTHAGELREGSLPVRHHLLRPQFDSPDPPQRT